MSSDRTAVFPGTFDPFTNGHLDLTRRAARLFDRVVVAVAENPAKGALFPMAERLAMIRTATRGLKRVEVVEFSDLVVDCARRVGAAVMIRGLRAVSDFEFEFQMALMNRRLSPSLEVAFLMPSQQYTYLNATLVKEVARLGGSVKGLVPEVVEQGLRARLGAPKRAAAAAEGDGAEPAEDADAEGGAPRARASKPPAARAGARARAAAPADRNEAPRARASKSAAARAGGKPRAAVRRKAGG
ncbi:MAG TPA: pantetheine-phosphate adenylyltransferase [Candidatus Eisenbacteria bacterium]|jgi:pantetheine-phosphate adenylyltransferase